MYPQFSSNESIVSIMVPLR